MKTLKRSLSFMLAFSIMLSLTAFAGYEDYPDAGKVRYVETVDVLSEPKIGERENELTPDPAVQKYTINSLRMYDPSTLKEFSYIPRDQFVVEASITNRHSVSADTLLLVQYSPDGQMLGMQYLYGEIGIGKTSDFGALIDNRDGHIGCIKAFVVPSIGNLIPLANCLTIGEMEEEEPDPVPTPEPDGAITELSVTRSLPQIEAVDGVEPYATVWYTGKNNITADLSRAPALAYSLTIGDQTTFAELPSGYDPDALIEWGKAPGLNVDILHKYGFTGDGAVVAYVDQPIDDHAQYADIDLHYTNNTDSNNSMHGPAVLSLLAGKDIGTAPEAEVYYYAHASWEADQLTHAECLYQIIEQNKTLPEGKKITMVGFSDNIDSSEANAEAFEEAVAACEDAGIMVWFCGEYGGMSFLPMSDKNDYRNLVPEQWGGGRPSLVYVPAAGRTTAATLYGTEYIYWSSGGLSWTMPYVLGLYGTAVEIDPDLTQDDLRALIVDTAYVHNGRKIINPTGFIAEVLMGVGRKAEARAMLAEVEARSRYLYAVMDTAAMSEADLEAVGTYLASITDAKVLVADSAAFANAEELYAALQADAAERTGEIVGVQIFGTPSMVPAFEVEYKVQMASAIDEGGTFLTDLFYSNFENDPEKIADGYNVCDHFAEDWDVDLVPQWPVARLPLEKGMYSAFMEKYMTFVGDTGLERPDLVNFSNPIFALDTHIDDMGIFLERMDSEFGLLDIPYRLYGNLVGDHPVSTDVIGGFTAENLAAENANGIAEFLINSHGQRNNIDKCYYVNGEEVRESLIHTDTIDTVLDDHPYYLDCWTCSNGYGMHNNLTTAALEGGCVGMFSATTTISNNGVDCNADLAEMAESNFYYFYYHYLKALHTGADRSAAFFEGQRAYAQALLADSADGITPAANYQFNLCNLLAYHNFGLLEPNHASAAFDASGSIGQSEESIPKDEPDTEESNRAAMSMTNGQPAGDVIEPAYTERNNLQTVSFAVHSLQLQPLDNGYMRFRVAYSSDTEMYCSAFNPPDGSLFMRTGTISAAEDGLLEFDLKTVDLEAVDTVTMKFYVSGDEYFFVFFQTSEIME